MHRKRTLDPVSDTPTYALGVGLGRLECGLFRDRREPHKPFTLFPSAGVQSELLHHVLALEERLVRLPARVRDIARFRCRRSRGRCTSSRRFRRVGAGVWSTCRPTAGSDSPSRCPDRATVRGWVDGFDGYLLQVVLSLT